MGYSIKNINETHLTMIKGATQPSNTIIDVAFNGEFQFLSFLQPWQKESAVRDTDYYVKIRACLT